MPKCSYYKIYIMIHPVYLSNDYIDSKEIGHRSEKVRFENLFCDSFVPEGYISSEEFRKRAFEKVSKFCNKHGIL